MRFIDIPAERLPAYAGVVNAIVGGRLDGAVVRGAFLPATLRHGFEPRLAGVLTALSGRPARRRPRHSAAALKVVRPGAGLGGGARAGAQLRLLAPLQIPERGGELIVRGPRADPLVLAPLAGDMVVVDARLRHRVARVGGRRSLRTIACCAAWSADGDWLLYWA